MGFLFPHETFGSPEHHSPTKSLVARMGLSISGVDFNLEATEPLSLTSICWSGHFIMFE